MIYTCYEMIRDCRTNRPEGWRYFVSNYVPVIRKLVAHYCAFPAGASEAGASDSAMVERVLAGVRDPQSSLFQSLEPAPERWFVAALRQKTLAEIVFPPPDHELELEAAAAAFAPLTLVEKQATWTEGMGYTAEQGGAMLRMAPATVAKIRDRAAELLRGQVDTWRRSILRENGPQLGLAASRARHEDCLSAKVFLDVLDGRASWRNREDMERHVTGCLHCVDHFCRMAEVIELLRGVQSLSDEEAAPYLKLMGVEAEKKKGWRRLIRA
jgi:hypothetical protein